MRSLINFLLLLCLLLPGAAFGADSLDALVLEALRNNPGLAAMQARWQVSSHREIPAGTLPDPVASLGLMNLPTDSLALDDTPMSGIDLKLAQKFPFPGKLGSKRDMAEYQTLWDRHTWEDARYQVAGQVRQAWYRLYFVDRAIEVTRKNIAVLDDFARLAETRYSVGKGLQQDVLKAQVERSRLSDKLVSLTQQRRTLQAKLNSLIGADGSRNMTPPQNLEPAPFDHSLDELRRLAREHRPQVAGYRALMDRFKAQRKLAKLDYRPDFTLWAGYRIREEVKGDPVKGQDFVSGGVSLNLPIWREKRGEQVAEADSAVRMVRFQLEQFLNQVDFRLDDAYGQMEKNRDLVSLYRDGILPQAEQAYRAALAAYQVGKVEVLTPLDALMNLYRYQIDYHRSVSDYLASLSRLEAETALGPGVVREQDN
ncbi:MAG: TolC family protein [Geothermobacteraceae bacterium]